MHTRSTIMLTQSLAFLRPILRYVCLSVAFGQTSKTRPICIVRGRFCESDGSLVTSTKTLMPSTCVVWVGGNGEIQFEDYYAYSKFQAKSSTYISRRLLNPCVSYK